ncbi:MAG: NAD(+) kinase, partial [Gammaproteobacteria bacterium]|nr:NAD(+) kinase [Gammaproteobacteria bacterium]
MTTKINNIGLVALYDDPRVAQTVLTLGQHLLAQQLGVVLTDDLQTPKGLDNVSTVPPEQLGEQCDLVIAVGGDGTMLHAARLVAEHSVPLVGINRGQLGFLADVRPSVMTEKIDAILAGQYIAEDRMMVRAELTKKDKSATMFGLNDVVIKRIDTARMLEFDIFLNGKFLNSQAGDGLIIATP